jgi:hypothetical protein
MKKSAKKRLIVILYIVFVLIPFIYTFAYIINNRPSQLELNFEKELSDIFDIPVEAGSLSVKGPRHYEIKNLHFKVAPNAAPFLSAKTAVFLSEDEGKTYTFRLRSCDVDFADAQDFKVIFGSLERIIKKQIAGRFPDLEINFAQTDVSFAIRGHPFSARNAGGDFTIRKGEEGALSLTAAGQANHSPVSMKGSFGWEGRSIEIASPALPFPAADFVREVFGEETAAPEYFDGRIVQEVSPGKRIFTLSGSTSIDASRYFNEKFVGGAKGIVKVDINSWRLYEDDSDFDIVLTHKSTPESNLVLSDFLVTKVAFLLTQGVPRDVFDKEVPEEVGLQIIKQGRDAKFKGTLDINSTWIRLSDPERPLRIETALAVDLLKQRLQQLQDRGLPQREPPDPWKQLKDFIYGGE